MGLLDAGRAGMLGKATALSRLGAREPSPSQEERTAALCEGLGKQEDRPQQVFRDSPTGADSE